MEEIRVEGLTFRYSGEPVLNKVGFTVSQGDFVALIGSNGAGKSTLIRLLLGELSPQAGSVLLWGEDPRQLRQGSRIGYVPQNGLVGMDGFPATVLEVVTLSLYSRIGMFLPFRKIHRQKALEALQTVGMKPFAGRMLGELSGGQFQRVMIARALAADCRLLLLDEPGAGVDSQSADALYELLGKLNREQKRTILLVTHDVEKLLREVTRIFCLERGSVVEVSEEEIRHELSHRHTHPILRQKEGDEPACL